MQEQRIKTVYFARPKTHYLYELRNAAVLMGMREHPEFPTDAQIVDPHNHILETIYQGLKRNNDPEPFELFKMAARACDYMIAVPFGDGKIGAGVANEIQSYLNRAPLDPKIFIACLVGDKFVAKLVTEHLGMAPWKRMTVKETREYIKNRQV